MKPDTTKSGQNTPGPSPSRATSWLRPQGRRPHVGICVEESRITLCALVRSGDTVRVLDHHTLPADAASRIPDVVRDMGWTGLHAIVALDDARFTSRNLPLPRMSGRDFRRVLARETVSADGARVSGWVREPEPGGGTAVAIRTADADLVSTWTQRLTQAGLVPMDIVSHAHALRETLGGADPSGPMADASGLVALVDAADFDTHVLLANAREAVSHRHLPRGWQGITHDGAPAQAIPAASTPSGAADGSPTDISPPDPVPPDAVVAERQRLVAELRRTHLHAKKNLKAGDVTRLVVASPSSAADIRWLGEALALPVMPFSEFRPNLHLATTGSAPGPGILCAAGAALWGLDRGRVQQPLLPASTPRPADVSPRMATAAGVLMLFFLASAAVVVWSQARAVASTRLDVISLSDHVSRQEAAARLRADAAAQSAASAQDIAVPFPGGTVLALLGKAMPRNSHVTEMTARWHADGWHLHVDGRVLDPSPQGLTDVGTMVEQLERTGLFSRVHLAPMQSRLDATPFTLRLTLVPRG